MGISAPPTRIAKITPNAEARIAVTQIGALITTQTTVAIIRRTIITVWPGITTGFCGRTLWSFPAATRLPVKVTKPITSAIADV